MSFIISIRPQGDVSNTNPHILFTGASYNFTLQYSGGELQLITSKVAKPFRMVGSTRKVIQTGTSDFATGLEMGPTLTIGASGEWLGPGTNLNGN